MTPTETELLEERKRLTAHLGTVLRAARTQASLTQFDVAERIGIATEVLGRMERGNMLPSVPTLRRLCHVLHVDANRVLGLQLKDVPTWLPPSEPGTEAPPELRRLLRMLRGLDAAQLTLMHGVTLALLKYAGHKPDEPTE